MAFPTTPTTQSAGLVRQKCYAMTRGSAVFYMLKAFFLNWASNKQNQDLRLVNLDGLTIASDGGTASDQSSVDGPFTLYAIYLKKTGATASYFKITNHATVSATDGSQEVSLNLTSAGNEVFAVYVNGLAFATGGATTFDTTASAGTAGLKANRVDGFMLIGV